MTWDENKHPRDDEGKFTYKNSANEKNMSDKEIKKYRDNLLNILGDRATPADILYAGIDKLEKKIEECGFQNKLKGTTTGAASGINQNSVSKEYSKPTISGKITSPYGNRIHPIKKVTKFHDGIDIDVPIGTPVNAVTNGKVTFVGKKTGYGNYIEIQYKNLDGDNITTFYAHLNDFKTKGGKILKVGQSIKQGEQIGHSGNTGVGTGAHLHLGARKNGTKINPIDIIGNVYPKKQYK